MDGKPFWIWGLAKIQNVAQSYFENSFTAQNVPLLMQNFKESINISLVWIFDEKTGALMYT